MRFRDRPLLPDGLDSQIYVDRPRLEQALLSALEVGRNVLLVGEAGAGKSTLLRRIAALLEREDQPSVLVNAAAARNAREFLELVDAALEERLPSAPRRETATTSEPVALVQAVRGLARPSPVVIMVDDPGESAYDVFARLRDELWSVGHVWLVAVRPRDSGPLRTPPADAFWGRVVEIPPLDFAETDRLLRLGLTDDEYRELDADRLLSGAHPRYVIRWAQDVLDRTRDGLGFFPTASEKALLSASLNRSESMALAELEGIGRPVSAHDPEFLDRLGWSRAYAQRILSGLEERGLVRSIPERSDRPGRPRKLYETVPHPTVE